MFDEIRKKQVDEKKNEKKKKKEWKEDKKEGRGFGWIFFKKNYNYTSPQQIKIKYIIIAMVWMSKEKKIY